MQLSYTTKTIPVQVFALLCLSLLVEFHTSRGGKKGNFFCLSATTTTPLGHWGYDRLSIAFRAITFTTTMVVVAVVWLPWKKEEKGRLTFLIRWEWTTHFKKLEITATCFHFFWCAYRSNDKVVFWKKMDIFDCLGDSGCWGMTVVIKYMLSMWFFLSNPQQFLVYIRYSNGPDRIYSFEWKFMTCLWNYIIWDFYYN